MAKFTTKKHSFSDEKVEPGEKYTYILARNDESSFETVGRIELSIPYSTTDPARIKVKTRAEGSGTRGALTAPPNERTVTLGDL